jgi:membrane associated rhomboid family serine protease
MPPVTPIVKYLLIANVVIFALVVFPRELGFTAPLEEMLALYYPGSDLFRPFQVLSHFFMHGSLTHLLFNMMGLYFLGPIIEMRLGWQRFLILYFVTALAAAGLHTLETWYNISQTDKLAQVFGSDPTIANLNALFASMEPSTLLGGETRYGTILASLQSDIALNKDIMAVVDQAWYVENAHTKNIEQLSRVVGASGAISGIAAAFAVLFPWQKLQIIFIPIGVYAAYMIPFFFGIDLVLGLLDLSIDNVAHFAHIGGGVAGAILAFVWSKKTTPPWMKRADPGAQESNF